MEQAVDDAGGDPGQFLGNVLIAPVAREANFCLIFVVAFLAEPAEFQHAVTGSPAPLVMEVEVAADLWIVALQQPKNGCAWPTKECAGQVDGVSHRLHQLVIGNAPIGALALEFMDFIGN